MADMRLIDANTVEKLSFYTTRKNDDYIEGYFDGVRDAKEVVRNSETIDPETLRPVAHWKVGGVNPVNGVVGNWKCSLCNGTSLKDSPFCPCCGAKME